MGRIDHFVIGGQQVSSLHNMYATHVFKLRMKQMYVCTNICEMCMQLCRICCAEQVADAQRVEQLQHHPLGGVVDCVMSPGDAVFVHGTTLHMSEGNLSDQRRLAFAAHFTRAHNEQFVDPFLTGLVCLPPTPPRRAPIA